MSDTRTPMSEEQRRMLEAQLGGQFNAPPQPAPTAPYPQQNVNTAQQFVQQPMQQPVQQPVQQTQPVQQQAGMSQQQILMERMRAARNQPQQSSQQVVLQQTADYQPNNGVQPNPTTVTSPPPPPADQTPVQQNTGNGASGILSNKKMVFAIIGIVIVACLVGYMLLSKGGKGSDSGEGEIEEPNFDELEWLDPVGFDSFLYTPDEIESLRAAGYTGPEIEDYQSQSIPADELIKQAEAKRDAWIQEAVAPLYDTASDEYKHYISQTWLTLPKRDDISEWTDIACEYLVDKNLDYEKIDVYGNQLILKIYLDDNAHDSWFFLNVKPEEWNRLNDAGNVLVHYTYETKYIIDESGMTEDTSSIYITDATLEFTGTYDEPSNDWDW